MAGKKTATVLKVTAHNAKGSKVGEFTTTPQRLPSDLTRNSVGFVDGFAVEDLGIVRPTKEGRKVTGFKMMLDGEFITIPNTAFAFRVWGVNDYMERRRKSRAATDAKMSGAKITQRSLDRR